MGLALLGTTLLTFVLFVCFIVNRTQQGQQKSIRTDEDRTKVNEMSKTIRFLKLGLSVSLIVVGITAGMSLFGGESKDMYLEHNHDWKKWTD